MVTSINETSMSHHKTSLYLKGRRLTWLL